MALTSETMNLMRLYTYKNPCFDSQGNKQNSYQSEMLSYSQQDQGLELQEIY